jgi:hypothetical protein
MNKNNLKLIIVLAFIGAAYKFFVLPYSPLWIDLASLTILFLIYLLYRAKGIYSKKALPEEEKKNEK